MRAMMNGQKILGLAVAVCAGVTAVGSAQAAVLEEVIVTAQKREQNLQDVGGVGFRVYRRSGSRIGLDQQ